MNISARVYARVLSSVRLKAKARLRLRLKTRTGFGSELRTNRLIRKGKPLLFLGFQSFFFKSFSSF